jgi:hypothetical protein
MSKDNITLIISAKDAASTVLHSVKARTIALGVAIGNLSSAIIKSAVSGFRGWINEALEAEQANVRLEAALRGLGQYTPELSAQYMKLANAIQDETGASDESVKNNIALLASYGVMPEAMGRAARSIEALNALGIEQTMAARAVARAIEGDMSAFERLSPAVRLATTDQEKAIAINALIASGFEQQQANLHTVGGAWSALQGRMGDFREAVIGAIFEGLKLGNTFNDAQKKLGAFLNSAAFNSLTDRLREMAALAKDIFTASTSDFGGTMKAIGQVIFAALSDGADVAAEKIASALGVSKTKTAETWHNDPIARGARWLGGFVGSRGSTAEASAQANKKYDDTSKQNKLPAAIDNLKKTIESINSRKESSPAGAAIQGVTDAQQQEQKKQQLISDETITRIKEDQVAAEDRKLWLDNEINAVKEEIKTANENERFYAKEAEKYAAQRAQLAKQGIAAFVAEQLGNIDKQKQQDKADDAVDKKYKAMKARTKNATKISEKDRNFMEAYERRGKLNRGLANQQANAMQQAEKAKAAKEAGEQELSSLQKQQVQILSRIETKLDQALCVD